MHERRIMPKVPDAPLSLSLTEIALRVGAAFALTVVIAILIFFAMLFVLGTG
jgi:hypothetical protein